MIRTLFLRNLLPESGVPNGQKAFTLYKNGMFSYMVELNDAESFLVAYSNYETVQILKNVERRLSQQMVMNDTLFLTIF